MKELALFAGAGGGILGGKLLGWTTVCAVEWEPYPCAVLCARQNEGILPPFPIWDDVRTFDGKPWRGRVDVVSGGFPCQDISAAGKGAGIDGERSGMWAHMARIIREVGPRFAFVENSPMLTSRGLGRVLGDLAAMGYDARWGVLGAHHAGAPHKRDRIWIVADAKNSEWRSGQFGKQNPSVWPQGHDKSFGGRADVADAERTQADSQWGADQCGRVAVGRDKQTAQREDRSACADRPDGCGEDVADAEKQFARRLPIGTSSQYPRLGVSGENVADASVENVERQRVSIGIQQERSAASCSSWWITEPDVGRVAHGVAARVDRLKAIGNGQVPAVAALAWEILSQEFDPVI